MNRVIDFRIRPPLAGSLESLEALPQFRRYREIYRTSSRMGRLDPERGREMLLEEMDDAGVDKAVLVAEDMRSTLGRKIPNESIAEWV